MMDSNRDGVGRKDVMGCVDIIPGASFLQTFHNLSVINQYVKWGQQPEARSPADGSLQHDRRPSRHGYRHTDRSICQ